uniref:Dynein axonemal heavy chain 3 n=1 Tax=Crocodylus porosus TaxID=8502 RepID=A0A7M4FUM3_CROPO
FRNPSSSQNDSVYNMSHSKGIPELPPLPPSVSSGPSELYQLVLKNSRYPPLMQRVSWTLAVPFKEQRYHRSPSDSIANNYTLTSRDLKLSGLHKMVSPSVARATFDSAKQRESYAKTVYSSDSDLFCACRHIPEKSMIPYSDNHPLTPEEQFVVMHLHEEEIFKQEKVPSNSDIERYCYYIHNGVQKDMLAPQDKEAMSMILKHIPDDFLTNPNLEKLLQSLQEEIQTDYHLSLMKAIVDYILMDPTERKRLFIRSFPRSFPQRVIRAPVPWHNTYQEMKDWNESHLFIVNPMMHTLQHLWFTEFSNLRFVRTEEMLLGELPLLPDEFGELIQRHCMEARDILQKKWIPTCASLFIDQKEKWLHLAPQNDYDSPQQIEEYFASVANLMSLQLREMVVNSLEDLLAFFMIHKDGNDFREPYQEMEFFVRQILIIKLSVEEPKIVFEPPMKKCWDLIYHCFMEILRSSEELPKVEVQIFPELKREDHILHTVRPEESLVSEYVNKAARIFENNTVGPQKYLNVYRKYSDLLNNKAEQEVTNFLKESHSLEAFTKKINSLTKLKKEIASMHVTVPLAMFCLDALKLNEELCSCAQKLKDRLIEFEVDENRELNKRYMYARLLGYHYILVFYCMDISALKREVG